MLSEASTEVMRWTARALRAMSSFVMGLADTLDLGADILEHFQPDPDPGE